MISRAQDKGTTRSTVLEFWYTEGASDSDFDSSFDSSPNSHDDSDSYLCYSCWSFGELVPEVVFVVEPGDVVDIMVDTKTIIGIVLHPYMEPWE